MAGSTSTRRRPCRSSCRRRGAGLRIGANGQRLGLDGAGLTRHQRVRGQCDVAVRVDRVANGEGRATGVGLTAAIAGAAPSGPGRTGSGRSRPHAVRECIRSVPPTMLRPDGAEPQNPAASPRRGEGDTPQAEMATLRGTAFRSPGPGPGQDLNVVDADAVAAGATSPSRTRSSSSASCRCGTPGASSCCSSSIAASRSAPARTAGGGSPASTSRTARRARAGSGASARRAGEHELLDLALARGQRTLGRRGVVQQRDSAGPSLELRRQEQPGVEPVAARAAHTASMPGTISRSRSW